MAMFQGFTPQGMNKIQQRMGYTGSAEDFEEYLQSNPNQQMMMNRYVTQAMRMASGGYVRNFQTGGFNLPQGFNPQSYAKANPDVQAAIDAGQFSSAAEHFKAFGGGEDRQGVTGFTPPQNFDATSYLDSTNNPDLAADFAEKKQADPNLTSQQYAVEHFTNFGGGEDRQGVPATSAPVVPAPPVVPAAPVVPVPPVVPASPVSLPSFTPPPDFNPTSYLDPANNPDLAADFEIQKQADPTLTEENYAREHYSNFGGGEDRRGVTTTQPPPPPVIPGQSARVDGGAYLTNRQDVVNAINAGNTFGLDPTSLQGLSEQEKNQRLAQAHYDAFGNTNRINPATGLAIAPTNFDDVSDEVIMDYLDQYPDLRNAGIDTLAEARAHYANFGRNEIESGGRPPLVQFDLTPQQLEAFRYSNSSFQNMTPKELRTTYIAIGGSTGATNFDRNAQVLNNAQLQIYRDNNPDLVNLNDYDLKAHFIQFGRQEMLQNKRPKIDALVPPQSPYAGLTSIADISASRLETPVLADGTRLDAQKIAGPDGTVPTGTDIATTTGQLGVTDPVATAGRAATPTGATATPQGTVAQVADTTKTATGVQGVTDATAGRTMSLTQAKPDAAQQTTSAVTGQTAETGTGIAIDPSTQVQRAGITEAETVAPVAKASEAATFVEQIVAQSANPSASATVAGQLSNLLTDFDASNPPSWAAGAMRAATAEMVRRGLGSSSIAGQAIVQAAMEAALPIAQADAQIQAQFEGQNLSNKQQMAVFYAQQRASFMGQEFNQGFQARVTNAARVADIADKNFTAQQQVQLENSNIVNTMNLSNLSNRQAVQMAEIASLAQLDISNLNNRQQAAVMEAQAFLQKDLTDVSNAQQTTLFNAQQRIQSMFTDSAADNARKQFNASSDNQSNQFFANLATQTSQFNDAQKNAINQFNAGQDGTVSRFNAEIENQRDQFNAQNRLVIDQANAVWRRQIATADTAAQNRTNELNASALLDISNTAYSDLWQQYSDMIEFAYTSAENELDRIASLAEANINADTRRDIADEASSTAAGSAIGNLVGTLGAAFIGAKFK